MQCDQKQKQTNKKEFICILNREPQGQNLDITEFKCLHNFGNLYFSLTPSLSWLTSFWVGVPPSRDKNSYQQALENPM